MTEPEINSSANPRIKSLVRLRTRRERDRTGRFLVEGYRELSRALEAGVKLEELYVARDLFLGDNEPELIDRASGAGAEIVEVAAEPFRKASYRERPEGLLGVARQFPASLAALDLTGTPLLLVAEGIEKPGNLGTMLRTADAAGANGVIVADPTTDPFNPNVVRASLGTLFTVPLAVADTEAVIATLRSARVSILAATPRGARPHHGVDLTGSVALVVGSEQYGLSARWLEAADERVVIRMPGPVDSLNAAMAAGILLFEAVRQREIG
ncbi:MAG: RNA methyltransferase [Actinomycetota bacterium]|nr:RNA methyltransferase [Actinomycetota bacterium]